MNTNHVDDFGLWSIRWQWTSLDRMEAPRTPSRFTTSILARASPAVAPISTYPLLIECLVVSTRCYVQLLYCNVDSSVALAYQQVFYSVGQILLPYDADGMVPCYGFGARLPSGQSTPITFSTPS